MEETKAILEESVKTIFEAKKMPMGQRYARRKDWQAEDRHPPNYMQNNSKADFKELSEGLVDELIDIVEDKIQEFIKENNIKKDISSFVRQVKQQLRQEIG